MISNILMQVTVNLLVDTLIVLLPLIQVKDGRSFMKYQSDMHRYLRKMVISGNK